MVIWICETLLECLTAVQILPCVFPHSNVYPCPTPLTHLQALKHPRGIYGQTHPRVSSLKSGKSWRWPLMLNDKLGPTWKIRGHSTTYLSRHRWDMPPDGDFAPCHAFTYAFPKRTGMSQGAALGTATQETIEKGVYYWWQRKHFCLVLILSSLRAGEVVSFLQSLLLRSDLANHQHSYKLSAQTQSLMHQPINGSSHGWQFLFFSTGIYLQGLQIVTREVSLHCPPFSLPMAVLSSFHLGFVVFCISTVLFMPHKNS